MPLAVKTAFRDPHERQRAGRFGMWLFLASIGALFVATMLALVIVRLELGEKGLWPADIPPPPWGLAASTVVLAASSVTMQRGVHRPAPYVRATFWLGLVFLAIQAACWLSWLGVVRARWAESDQWRLALTGFYVLTGLHGLHVVGGLIALATAGASRVRFCALYWHFLGVAWLAIYAILLVWR